ncbi:MAG: hypothetical protein ISR77_19330 [Pirellulaceae bacterium]|nr:hypothetical protein [Pirellulaceae bacterium]
MIRQMPGVPLAMWLVLGLGAVPVGAADETLTFDEEMATVIWARQWNDTQTQWLAEKERERPLFFDAVHRFLLLRFPGCAEAIAKKLAAGHEIASARLVLTWHDQEWLRADYGYHHRGYRLKEMEPETWHARVWLLRRPWTADAKIGPTWNAHINGAGYWTAGGARDTELDRWPDPLGQAPLGKDKPTGTIDVTAALAQASNERALEQRLRDLEACGFLIDRAELATPAAGSWGLSTGNCRVFVTDPKLVVTFRRAEAVTVTLPPTVDVSALARELRATGTSGQPPVSTPEDLQELARGIVDARPDMPEWMKRRVHELRTVPVGERERDDVGYRLANAFDSGDQDAYLKVVEDLLIEPPGWFRGHSHLDFLIPLVEYDPMLNELLRYHLHKYFESRWLHPFIEDDLRVRAGYRNGISTLNLMTQFRSEVALVGELLNRSEMTVRGNRNISHLNRHMIWSEGTHQERGDTFYLGITLGNLKMVSRYAKDPLARLRADLGVEKILFEENTNYHPGLRRRVSRVARRYRIDDLLMRQDVPRGVLHTLSKKGVLIETDKEQVHGIPTVNFHACQPVRVALLAPWGPEWETHAIDDKPLPSWSVSTNHVRHRMNPPVHDMTYLGKHYGLSCMDANIGVEWPVLAVWKRTERDVQHLEDLGILWPWPYVNGKLVSDYNQQEPKSLDGSCPQASLQHHNKMIHVVRPLEKVFAAESLKEGIHSFSSRILAYMYAEAEDRELWIDDKRITSYPITAKQGDVITLGDGVSYVGLIPLPATDLGRDTEVEIRFDYPRLELESFVLKTGDPLPSNDDTWAKLRDATAGWIIEMGDHTEHGSFQEFRTHMRAAKVARRWDAAEKVLHVGYTSGGDQLELGVNCGYVRTETSERYIRPRDLLTYFRVNGQNPWPPIEIDLDSPIGQLGTAARLEKAGAVLETAKGQMALLKVERVTGTYTAINPFIDPTPLRLTTPDGAMLKTDGPASMTRIHFRPNESKLWIDYRIPPPEGDKAVEMLFKESQTTHPWYQRYFRDGVDVTKAHQQSARFLLVTGIDDQPIVVLNGDPLPGPLTSVTAEGRTWFRVPIVKGEKSPAGK